MSYFNDKQTSTKVYTYEGGEATEKTLDQEWTNMVFSSFLQSGFYEDESERVDRMIELNKQIIAKYGTEFGTKALNYIRNTLGMRTTSALFAAMLNSEQFEGKRQAFSDYFRRPDDVSEVFAAIDSIGGKRSHALVRGASDYLSRLNAYTLGKYKLNGHKYNMYDLINLTHAHSAVIDDYKNGKLDNPETWEVLISTAKDEDDKVKNWRNLVLGGKLGYLALIRNLRNYLPSLTLEEVREVLVPQLVNRETIKRSLVFPYQIYAAYKAITGVEHTGYYWDDEDTGEPIMTSIKTPVINALNNAFIYSLDNVPAIKGNNCVIVDVSGSMDSPWSDNSSLTILEVSSVYAACVYLANEDNCTLIKFGTEAKKINPHDAFRYADNVFDIIHAISRNDDCGYGTYIDSTTKYLTEKYDSIFLFSDMQVMGGGWYYGDAPRSFYDYFKKFGPVPMFSFDLGNYHTRVKTGYDNVYPITTLSSTVFDFIQLVKEGKTLIDAINES